jgi:hypothetical protein
MQNGDVDADEVELALLDEEARERAAVGVDVEDAASLAAKPAVLSPKDKRAMVLLCFLCEYSYCNSSTAYPPRLHPDLIQGVPVSFSASNSMNAIRQSLIIARPCSR